MHTLRECPLWVYFYTGVIALFASLISTSLNACLQLEINPLEGLFYISNFLIYKNCPMITVLILILVLPMFRVKVKLFLSICSTFSKSFAISSGHSHSDSFTLVHQSCRATLYFGLLSIKVASGFSVNIFMIRNFYKYTIKFGNVKLNSRK